ncbi:glycosyltransferase [Aestuariimicrobium sp. p3-SID1156]|uniref:CgeB family protein n=1 Tax=Aestuariimicrobium sp. p3-SID1156 TaxID=2916038 RepID=UPI00223B6D37|nr:glycosyltransferase [Aestuariimicrobium sp. p3-SID1156]MCT1458279.1 glycosyltransferase [Aestuariimicrobium sp. p3-SID1156]
MRDLKLLLVTPTFHGYGQSIARGFRRLGYQVMVDEFDRLDTAGAKFRHKLRVELPARLARAPHAGAEANEPTATLIRETRPDVVLFLRGDNIADPVFDAVQGVGARPILWLWDEVRRTRHTSESLDRFPQLISYSTLDTQQLVTEGRLCIHVHNAFDDSMTPRHARYVPGILFVGARYPRRQQLVEALCEARVPVTAVGRSWSHHPFDRARTWEWSRPKVHSLRDVPREEGYAMTAGAPAALNIHFDQDGFTMKTFEVPGVGGVQLIDRADVSDLYEPGSEVLVYDSPEELIDLSGRCISDDRWGDAIRRRAQQRTLAHHTFVHRARQVEQLWA